MTDTRVLVTGGAGFIGSHIVALLLETGRRVRVLDNFSTGRMENLAGLAGQLEVIEGDVRDQHTARRAVDGCSSVSHQAALPSVLRSIEDPIGSNLVNVGGTLNMLVAARDAGVRRFVYASSSSVYGDSPELPKREDMLPLPLSPYAAGKLAGEHYCAVFSRLFGMSCISLRYFNVFGPRQDPNSPYAAVIPRFFMGLMGKGELVIDGDGEQTRDFTFVRNVAEANLRALESSLPGGEAVNIACGESTSINNLFSIMRKIVGSDLEPRHGMPRPGDVLHSRADISKARETIGFTPTIGLEEGLRITAGYFAA